MKELIRSDEETHKTFLKEVSGHQSRKLTSHSTLVYTNRAGGHFIWATTKGISGLTALSQANI